MHNLYDLDVLLQLAGEREASLTNATHRATDVRDRRQVQRWLGRQLVRTGTWLAREHPMQPLRAR